MWGLGFGDPARPSAQHMSHTAGEEWDWGLGDLRASGHGPGELNPESWRLLVAKLNHTQMICSEQDWHVERIRADPEGLRLWVQLGLHAPQ